MNGRERFSRLKARACTLKVIIVIVVRVIIAVVVEVIVIAHQTKKWPTRRMGRRDIDINIRTVA